MRHAAQRAGEQVVQHFMAVLRCTCYLPPHLVLAPLLPKNLQHVHASVNRTPQLQSAEHQTASPMCLCIGI